MLIINFMKKTSLPPERDSVPDTSKGKKPAAIPKASFFSFLQKALLHEKSPVKSTGLKSPPPEAKDRLTAQLPKSSRVSWAEEDFESPDTHSVEYLRGAVHHENVYGVDFITDTQVKAEKVLRADIVSAKQAFIKEVKLNPEQSSWLREILTETRPIVTHPSIDAPTKAPASFKTKFQTPQRENPIYGVMGKLHVFMFLVLLSIVCVFVVAEDLSRNLLNQVFDPKQTLQLHVSSRGRSPSVVQPSLVTSSSESKCTIKKEKRIH